MPPKTPVFDVAPAFVLDLLAAQADALDAAAMVLEERTDLVIAEHALNRALATLAERESASNRMGYLPDDLRALLSAPDAHWLRRAAKGYRELAARENGGRRVRSEKAA